MIRKFVYGVIGALFASLTISGKQEATDTSSFRQQETKAFLHKIQEQEMSEELMPLTKVFGMYDLTDYEQEVMGQVIMAEARGEGF